MNVWKPIALCLAAGLVISVGIQTEVDVVVAACPGC